MEEGLSVDLEKDEETFGYLLNVVTINDEKLINQEKLTSILNLNRKRFFALEKPKRYTESRSLSLKNLQIGEGNAIKSVAKVLDVDLAEIETLFRNFRRFEAQSLETKDMDDLMRKLVKYYFYLEQCKIKCLTALVRNANLRNTSPIYVELLKDLVTSKVDRKLIEYYQFLRAKVYREVSLVDMLEIVSSSSVLLEYDVLTALFMCYFGENAISFTVEDIKLLVVTYWEAILNVKRPQLSLDLIAREYLKDTEVLATLTLLGMIERAYDFPNEKALLQLSEEELSSISTTLMNKRAGCMRVVHFSFATLLQTRGRTVDMQEHLKIALSGEGAMEQVTRMLSARILGSEEDEARPLTYVLFRLLMNIYVYFDVMNFSEEVMTMLFEDLIAVLRLRKEIVHFHFDEEVFMELTELIIHLFPYEYALVLEFLTILCSEQPQFVLRRFNELRTLCGPADSANRAHIGIGYVPVKERLVLTEVETYSGWTTVMNMLENYRNADTKDILATLRFIARMAKYHDIANLFDLGDRKDKVVTFLLDLALGISGEGDFVTESIECVFITLREMCKFADYPIHVLKATFNVKFIGPDGSLLVCTSFTEKAEDLICRKIHRHEQEVENSTATLAFLELLHHSFTFLSTREVSANPLFDYILGNFFSMLLVRRFEEEYAHQKWKLGHHILNMLQHKRIAAEGRKHIHDSFLREAAIYSVLFQLCAENPEKVRELYYCGSAKEALWLENVLNTSLGFMECVLKGAYARNLPLSRMEEAALVGGGAFSLVVPLAAHSTSPWKLKTPTLCNRILALFVNRARGTKHSHVLSGSLVSDALLNRTRARLSLLDTTDKEGMERLEEIRCSTVDLITAAVDCENELAISILGSSEGETTPLVSVRDMLKDVKRLQVMFETVPAYLHSILNLVLAICRMYIRSGNEYSTRLVETLRVDKSLAHLSCILDFAEVNPSCMEVRRMCRLSAVAEESQEGANADIPLSEMNDVKRLCFQKAAVAVLLDILVVEQEIGSDSKFHSKGPSVLMEKLLNVENVARFAVQSSHTLTAAMLREYCGTMAETFIGERKSGVKQRLGTQYLIPVDIYYGTQVMDDDVRAILEEEEAFAMRINLEYSVAESERAMTGAWKRKILYKTKAKITVELAQELVRAIEKALLLVHEKENEEASVHIKQLSEVLMVLSPTLECKSSDCRREVLISVRRCFDTLKRCDGESSMKTVVFGNLAVYLFFVCNAMSNGTWANERLPEAEAEAMAILRVVGVLLETSGHVSVVPSAICALLRFLRYSDESMAIPFESEGGRPSLVNNIVAKAAGMSSTEMEHVLHFLALLFAKASITLPTHTLEVLRRLEYRSDKRTWGKMQSLFVVAATRTQEQDQLHNFVLENLPHFHLAVESLVQTLMNKPIAIGSLDQSELEVAERITSIFCVETTRTFGSSYSIRKATEVFTPLVLGLCNSLIPYVSLEACNLLVLRVVRNCVAYLRNLIPTRELSEKRGQITSGMRLDLSVSLTRNVFPYLGVSFDEVGLSGSKSMSIDAMLGLVKRAIHMLTAKGESNAENEDEENCLCEIIELGIYCVVEHIPFHMVEHGIGRAIELASQTTHTLEMISRNSKVGKYTDTQGRKDIYPLMREMLKKLRMIQSPSEYEKSWANHRI